MTVMQIGGSALRPGDKLCGKTVAAIPPFVRRPVPGNSCSYTYATTVTFTNGDSMELEERTRLLIERE